MSLVIAVRTIRVSNLSIPQRYEKTLTPTIYVKTYTMAKSHKSLPKPTNKKTINKRNKLQFSNQEIINRLFAEFDK